MLIVFPFTYTFKFNRKRTKTLWLVYDGSIKIGEFSDRLSALMWAANQKRGVELRGHLIDARL